MVPSVLSKYRKELIRYTTPYYTTDWGCIIVEGAGYIYREILVDIFA